jgi:tRNA threonylcarbamoyladenosine biosynthesis protein TsaE
MELRSLADTHRLAQHLAGQLPQGAIVLLTGPLGVGKTSLVQQLARCLGFDGEVTSPTYTLIHEYPTPGGLLIHIDAYRLENQEDLYGLGLEDYLPVARAVLIEWGQPQVFPNSLEIQLSFVADHRQVQLLAHHPRYQPVVSAIVEPGL